MAWGSSAQKPPPPPSSTLGKLVPLVILFSVLIAFAFVGFQIYLVMGQIADTANKKLEKKNVTFTKDGMKVGVKEVKEESYVDQTQNMLVKAWNLSTWPAYRSRYWNKDQKGSDSPPPGARPQVQQPPASNPRNTYARSSSSSSGLHAKAS
ncbi:MAG: hypothetical protein M4579_005869 [Chaenotheca gracillima]|nr:MAG: hypothetical protein M4579_005869 [Chaenotheca gracillima]